MFIDMHKEPDIGENCRIFLNKIEEIKFYVVGFDKNSEIKAKTYSFDI